MREIPDIECLGGPYDGSVVPCAQPQLVVAQFQASLYFHLYDKVREDDGSYFYRYAGTRERAPQAA